MRKLLTIAILLLGSTWVLAQDNYVQKQSARLNKLIDLYTHKHQDDSLAGALAVRASFFYNMGMSDSVALHLPHDLQTLRSLRQWDRYYEVWTHLINTYIYYNKEKTKALHEVDDMFNDAMERNHQYGMGIAYYTMGNVYLNFNNLSQSADAYQKGLDMLLSLKDMPSQVLDLYSYYGDVLNEQHEYHQLDSLTRSWKSSLEQFVRKHDLSQTDQDVLWFYYYIACAQAATGLADYEQAEQMLEKSRQCLHEQNGYDISTWQTNLAELRLRQQRYEEALELNSRRLESLSADEDKAVYLTVIRQRADILSHLGRLQDANRIYREMFYLKDSISNADTKSQLNEMNTLFQVDELKMEQERTQFRNTLIIAGIVLLAMVVFIVFRTIAARRLRKAHEQLQATHDELLTAYDQLEETTTAKERIESDLRIARNIQMGMVPSTFPERPDLDLYASMTPAKEVGGDLYGYYLTGDKLYFALGDVSGKGVPASLFMAQATRLFRTLAAQQLMPAQICTQINDALSGEDNETGMFVTMFLGLVDLQTGHLDFCNAGHNPPVLLTGGHAEFIEMVPNAPIGLWPELEYEGEEIADITGCPLFVYTDGLNEAENRQQEQFSDERLLELLETRPFESCRQTIELLRDEVERHRDGAEPNDDLTMLCVKVMPANEGRKPVNNQNT